MSASTNLKYPLSLISQSVSNSDVGPWTFIWYPIILASGTSFLNERVVPLESVAAPLRVKAVPSIALTVMSPEIAEFLTRMPTSIAEFAALRVTEVVLLTAPDIVDSVFCFICKGGCQLISKSALVSTAESSEVSILFKETEALKASTLGTVSVLTGGFWCSGTISVTYPLSTSSNFLWLYSTADITIWFEFFSSVFTITYSLGAISSSSTPVESKVDVNDQITSAFGVSEKAEDTVKEESVPVVELTGLLSTLTESDQWSCTKSPESSFTFDAFSRVSIDAPLSSNSTKSPKT